MVKSAGLNTYVEWSTNEKVALDNAYAAAIAGKRAAVCMKQVGLNVAADSLMSAAYIGTIGGLVMADLGRPPLEGDEVSFNGITLTVDVVDGLSIKQVTLRFEPSSDG